MILLNNSSGTHTCMRHHSSKIMSRHVIISTSLLVTFSGCLKNVNKFLWKRRKDLYINCFNTTMIRDRCHWFLVTTRHIVRGILVKLVIPSHMLDVIGGIQVHAMSHQNVPGALMVLPSSCGSLRVVQARLLNKGNKP